MSALTITSLSAEDPFEPSIDIGADVVSTYIFRGSDFHQGKFTQDGETISGMNIAPALQPSLTFNFAEGWSMGLWGSYALTGREDVDTDGQFQYGPGGTTAVNLLSNPAPTEANFAAAFANPSTGCTADSSVTVGTTVTQFCSQDAISSAIAGGSYTAPGFYKEQNGLKRFDEVDFTLSYSVDTKHGTMSGGIIAYVLPNSAAGVTGVDQFTEFFVGFAPAFLPGFGITTYAEINGDGAEGSTYTYFDYGLDIGETGLGFSVGAGYQTQNNLQGWRNVDLGLSYSIGGFSIGATAVYRPNTAFYDSGLGKNVPGWLFQTGTQFDGEFDDPSKTTGLVNAYIQNELTNNNIPTILYTQQDIPRVVYFFSVGYSTSI